MRGIGEQELLDERDELGRTAAPAGGLAVSANDMARWLQIQLDARRAAATAAGCSAKRRTNEMWTPVSSEPIAPCPTALEADPAEFKPMRWAGTCADYRGAKIVWHGGGVFGFNDRRGADPGQNVGFSIEINSEDGEIIRVSCTNCSIIISALPDDRTGRRVTKAQEAPYRGGARGT